ncbi:MAG: hypothetical protein JXO22_13460 [Phycisphaerae bacterium]|nr:hypothetical protein [Phycisphaerae bacterium]
MRCIMYTLAIVVLVATAANTFADNCATPAGGDRAVAKKACAGSGDACCTKDAAACKTADGKAACATKTTSATKGACDGKAACGIACAEKVTAGMPVMAYSVSDKSTRCPEEAKALADGDSSKIKFVVADESYDNEQDALAAYAKHLDGYLKKMTAVEYVIGDDTTCCPNSAKALAEKNGKPIHYRVATVDFDSKEQAEKAAKVAAEAADKISLTTMVDGKPYTCEKSAAAACQLSEKKSMAYCVGEMKTECRKTADVALLQAKILSAAEAVAKLQG